MPSRLPSPDLQSTRQEKASGFLSATLLLLGLMTLFMFVAWLSQQRSYVPTVSRLSLRGEQEQGSGSTGNAEIFRPLDDPMTEDQPQELAQMAVNLQLVSTLATTELAAIEQTGGLQGNGLGIDPGDGRKKGPGTAGGDVVPNWQRWQIRYAATDTQEYAKILDAFDVELGVLGGGVQSIEYARDFSRGIPKIRSGKLREEKRLRFTFERGDLKEADRTLAQNAGLSIEGRVVSQFFPDAARQQLELLERGAIGTRPLSTVRHTVFGIRQGSRGLEFFVLRVEPPLASGSLTPL